MEAILDRVKSARDAVMQNLPRRENVMATRWVWHPLMSISQQDVTAINEGEPMLRLKWQPIIQAPRWEHILNVPEGERQAIRPAPPAKPREAMYFIKPARIADSLVALYSESGLVNSAALFGVELDMAARCRLDEIFFPESQADLPMTYRACEQRITEQIARLRDGKPCQPDGTPVSLANELVSHVIEIGNEMLEGLRRAALYVRRHLDERHAEMEKAKTDTTGRYRGTYDQKDYNLLAWAEVAPRDQALNKLASDHNSLPEMVAQAVQAGMSATAEMIKGSQLDEQKLGATIGAAIGASLAETLRSLMPPPQQPSIEEVAREIGKAEKKR